MNLQQEFPLNPDIIYLNHAAVAPWPNRTCQAVKQFAEENMLYGSLNYLTWLEVESHLRLQLQQLINAPSSQDIALLKNTSEALSVVAYGLNWEPNDNVVISDEEFPSNRIVWESLQSKGVAVKSAHLTTSNLSPEETLIQLCDEKTRLLSVSSIQYASGLRLDLNKLGRFCREQGILFCVDAIQSVGAVQFDVQQAQVDFAMADGHKWMLGPEGLAFFYSSAAAREKLKLTQYGWHMVEHMGDFDRKDWDIARDSRRFECGSPNMLGIHALSASISLLLEVGMDNIETAIAERTQIMIDYLQSDSQAVLLSNPEQSRRGGIVTFKPTTQSNESMYKQLTDNHVTCAMRGGGIRFSPHFYTPIDKIEAALHLILS
ncbi:aminotransferase class V-fold PLP-dependent enzyme [Kaarinaea lacus]